MERGQVGPMRTDGSRSVGELLQIAYMSVLIWLFCRATKVKKVLVRCGGRFWGEVGEGGGTGLGTRARGGVGLC